MLEAIRKRWAKAFGGNTFLEDLERSRRENLRHDFHLARMKADFDLSMQKMRLEVMRMECRRARIDPETAVMSDEALDTAHAAHMEELNRLERAFIGEPE